MKHLSAPKEPVLFVHTPKMLMLKMEALRKVGTFINRG